MDAPAPTPAPTKPASKESNIFAILSYLVPFFFIFSAMKKKDEFNIKHAKMGAILTAIFLIGLIIQALVWIFLGNLIYLAWFILGLIGAFKAFKHQAFDLPMLSELAANVPIGKIASEINEIVDEKSKTDTSTTETPTVEPTPAPIAPVPNPVETPTVEPTPTPIAPAPNPVETPTVEPTPTEKVGIEIKPTADDTASGPAAPTAPLQ